MNIKIYSLICFALLLACAANPVAAQPADRTPINPPSRPAAPLPSPRDAPTAAAR